MRPNGLTFNADGVANLPDDMKMLARSITLATNESYDLPSGVTGWGEVMGGLYIAIKFQCLASGSIYAVYATNGVEIADTGAASGDLCVYDNGSNVRITNRAVGDVTVRILFYYVE